jgi:pantoate--beta-alanine ligase
VLPETREVVPMRVIEIPKEARAWVTARHAEGRRVGFVPTMGALHEGHLSLVRRARDLADHVVVSIFVNPSQFGPNEDFSRYPRTWESDLRMLDREGVAMVFAPTPAEMYGPRFSTYVTPPKVAEPLEGPFRPGHFQGVCTVVLKLFQIIPAQVAVFGQKDYQQARVISDMVADLNLDIDIDLFPTVRDADGLALSSRNRYLAPADRGRSLSLSRALQRVDVAYRDGVRDGQELERLMRQVLERDGVDAIDYAAVVDPLTLLPIRELRSPGAAEPGDRSMPAAVALIAARISGTRLLDNRILR